jgi:hypothetical protein
VRINYTLSDNTNEVPFDGRIALLTIFQNLVNPSDEAQISVTLNVHGTLVSGTMIGMKRYYEEVSKKLSESVRAKSEEELSYVKKELQKLFDMIKQPPTKKEIETSDNRYDHIFLKDVQIYIGSAKVRFIYFNISNIYLSILFLK